MILARGFIRHYTLDARESVTVTVMTVFRVTKRNARMGNHDFEIKRKSIVLRTYVTNQWDHIDHAITRVKDMLLKKKGIWTSTNSPFENFDIAQEFHMTPIQWGLSMCNLKLNRIKNRYDIWSLKSSTDGLSADPDFEDSLIDLASYAILVLGLVEREKIINGTYENPDMPPQIREALDNLKLQSYQKQAQDQAQDQQAQLFNQMQGITHG